MRNSECPYSVKRRVWNSALNAATLYSCETWLTANLQAAETPYNTSLKQLLGVRSTMCNDLVYMEIGLAYSKSVIIDRQIRYLSKLRQRPTDDYIMKIVTIAINVRSSMGLRMRHLMNLDTVTSNSVNFLMKVLRLESSSHKAREEVHIYLRFNPNFEVSPILRITGATDIAEQCRISSTRLRLGSHHLRVETGRWSRIPLELRQCQMEVQTEEHVLLRCPISQTLRAQMNINSETIPELFHNTNLAQTAEYSHLILNLYRT